MTSTIKMAFHWKRPTTVPFPKVWRRYEAKLPNGEVQKFSIQDLTPERHEEAWDFTVKNIIAEEPVFRALKMTEDPNLMADIKTIFLTAMQQNVSLMALPEGTADGQRIAALAVLAAHSRNDEIVTQLCGPKAQKFESLMAALRENINVFDKLGTDVILEDYGTAVASEYRGRYLAHNIIMSVEEMARALGIGGKTVTVSNLNLSSTAKQEKMEILREIFYDNFRDADGNVIIPETEFKSVLYCGLKFL